jgi:hypothetical protein
MSPALLEKYPDYLPQAEALTDEDLEAAIIAVSAVKEELKRKGTPKEWPIPETVAQKAAEIRDGFPEPNSATAKAAAEIAIIETKLSTEKIVPDVQF